MGPAKPAMKGYGGAVEATPKEAPVVRAPEKVEVPRPEAVSRSATLKEVVEAAPRLDPPITLIPPAKTESPADTRKPREESNPATVRPPVKDEVAAPWTWRRLATVKEVEEAEVRLAPPATCSPPAKTESPVDTRRPLEESRPATVNPPVMVEVPAPETVKTLAIEKEVVLAIGKVFWRVVEVA